MSGNDDSGSPPDGPILFAARVVPHRSLSRGGFIALMSLFGAVSFAAGTVFLMMGAWPILGFFGLDVLLIWWAFKVNFRHAEATEDITVTPSEIRIRRVSHRGHVLEWSFNPLWVQIDQKIDPEFGIERLFLISRGRRVSVGHWLGPDEKQSFVKALMAALHAARRGVGYHPVA